MTEQWINLAATHARCSQFFLLAHHALLVPTIMIPVVFSLFDTTSITLKYIVVGASAATPVRWP